MLIKNQTLLLQLDESQTSVLLDLLRAGVSATQQVATRKVTENTPARQEIRRKMLKDCQCSTRLFRSISVNVAYKAGFQITLGDVEDSVTVDSLCKSRNTGLNTIQEFLDFAIREGLKLRLKDQSL